MTRVFVDWDAAGAFLSITRPGAPAEEVRLSEMDVVKLMQEAAQAWLEMRKRLQAPGRGYNSGIRCNPDYDPPPHFIGAMGE